jgi:Family of unknown function (DUF6152)
MRGKVFSFLVVAAGFAMVSSPISAHHGATNYDMKKTIVLTGTITAFDWSNPHCLAHLDVMDDSGHFSHWTLELSSTFTMSHRGWDRDTLKRGDTVIVETHAARNGAPVGISSGPGFALKIVVNGKEIPSR